MARNWAVTSSSYSFSVTEPAITQGSVISFWGKVMILKRKHACKAPLVWLLSLKTCTGVTCRDGGLDLLKIYPRWCVRHSLTAFGNRFYEPTSTATLAPTVFSLSIPGLGNSSISHSNRSGVTIGRRNQWSVQ